MHTPMRKYRYLSIGKFIFPKLAYNLLLIFSLSPFSGSLDLFGISTDSYIAAEKGEGRFTLSSSGYSAPLFFSSEDDAGVHRALINLQIDIGRVTGIEPELFKDIMPPMKEIVLVGTLGHNSVIDQMVRDRKLNIEDITGRWETFMLQVVEEPWPGVDRALVIMGSDRRGTIYGIYDLSAQIGVSPWYWWADVPVKKMQDIFVLPGHHTLGEPAVKYRGIFINDEAPALSGWAYEKFGGFNHEFYEKVFELILRLKGNYLWPAMWGRAFCDDDPLNPVLANEYGIVIGTSHHEPLMRAHDEWRRYGSGEWNYEKNEDRLKTFWKEGIERMASNESIVTIGMRGDGDEPMTEGTAIALLERIVRDQREILEEVTGRKASEIPQMWALYKEVQDYYDKGMRVPDDVTLLLCDDNWGNIRKLPKPGENSRSGGYGIYYHFDYVGGPRNYKWLNTNQIERVWEQMHLAYHYGVDRVWIVNVGDIKPMEFPIEFFLDFAWDPEKWPAERLPEYYQLWAEEQFGSDYSKEIAEILARYTKYNARRKPELISPGTYSLIHYQEADRIVNEYNDLAKGAEKIYNLLPPAYQDAFYQLVLFPVKACTNLNELYVTAGKNRMYARQKRAATNNLAERVKELFLKDAELTEYYHNKLANGKWNHMMSQSHIGYTYWQQPEKNNMPDVKEINIPKKARIGIAVQGSDCWWPDEKSDAVLPEFDKYFQQDYYIDIFNQGQRPFNWTVSSEPEWLVFKSENGKMEKEQRLWISIDWKEVPAGNHKIPITINGPRRNSVIVWAVVNNPESPKRDEVKGFVEANGYVSIEAEHYTAAIEKAPAQWQCIPNLGRTLSGITPVPVILPALTPGGNNPHLEYSIYLFSSGPLRVRAYLSPTLNFNDTQGLRYAVSFDDEPPQVINIHEDNSLRAWEQSVRDNIKVFISKHQIDKSGEHILKFWMVDPGIVLQKLVVETGDVKPSYLGPPESRFVVKVER